MFHISLPGRKKDEKQIDPEKGEVPKPVRRRKKEPPPKPWGKLERLIVFIFLLSAPIFSIFFLVRSKSSRNNLPAPITAQIINKIIPASSKNIDDLKQSLLSETQNLQGTYGIWFQTLDDKYNLGLNEKVAFDGASMFKVPLMIAYYEKEDSGQINPNTLYVLKYSDASLGSEVIANMPVGTSITYHDMVEAMGKNSDNAAFQIIGNTLGWSEEDRVIGEIGMSDTVFSTSQTTPYDIGLMFYKLGNNKLISSSSKDELLSFLTKTDYETLIPAGVPSDVKVSHKFATDDNELNDAGIIYAVNPFVLVILTKDINLDEAQLEIPKLTGIVYNWITGVK